MSLIFQIFQILNKYFWSNGNSVKLNSSQRNSGTSISVIQKDTVSNGKLMAFLKVHKNYYRDIEQCLNITYEFIRYIYCAFCYCVNFKCQLSSIHNKTTHITYFIIRGFLKNFMIFYSILLAFYIHFVQKLWFFSIISQLESKLMA